MSLWGSFFKFLLLFKAGAIFVHLYFYYPFSYTGHFLTRGQNAPLMKFLLCPHDLLPESVEDTVSSTELVSDF